MSVARPSSFLARKPHDSSPRGVAHLLRAHRHPLHRTRRPHATLQRAPRGPSTPGHTAGRRPRQRDPRRSPCNARPSARSSRSVNPRRGRGSRGSRRGRGTPAWFPQMSHVIPRTILQTLKSGRCNSNVFRAYRKLTKGNYVRLFGEERLPPADEAGTPQADARIVVAREPPATPVTPVGAPGNPRPRRDAPFISTRPGLVQRSQPQYANPLGCSAKTANPGSTTSKPLAL